ncbi:conserved Plasmodium protein, unknown function [Plasmodium malariae]|uniref:Uncharacterized protein n=1 Tax=Plasmodium malariae TaxID=5858 RepID=A0A1D3TFQ9_PLAMA|nr:conserved Plasmodium protein, unknown function [Plasmodium malariae]SCP03792.1 conserved Plasmodium protein, unknown function [Plasmodium malariae]
MSTEASYNSEVTSTLHETFGNYISRLGAPNQCSCSNGLNVFLGLLLFNVMMYLSYIIGKKEIFQKLKYHGYY